VLLEQLPSTPESKPQKRNHMTRPHGKRRQVTIVGWEVNPFFACVWLRNLVVY